jgi:hypothetical protein
MTMMFLLANVSVPALVLYLAVNVWLPGVRPETTYVALPWKP